MESEETYDYVRESKDLDQVEAEEMSFVPSEISVPQSVCVVTVSLTKKNFSIWQFASMVMKEGEESYTTIWYQQCYNKYLEEERNITDKLAVVSVC